VGQSRYSLKPRSFSRTNPFSFSQICWETWFEVCGPVSGGELKKISLDVTVASL
jgi:hypothetical protein